jgi:hypothetical protein
LKVCWVGCLLAALWWGGWSVLSAPERSKLVACPSASLCLSATLPAPPPAPQVLPQPERISICSELTEATLRCVRDQNGNHVVQKCIECVQPSEPARQMIEVGFLVLVWACGVWQGGRWQGGYPCCTAEADVPSGAAPRTGTGAGDPLCLIACGNLTPCLHADHRGQVPAAVHPHLWLPPGPSGWAAPPACLLAWLVCCSASMPLWWLAAVAAFSCLPNRRLIGPAFGCLHLLTRLLCLPGLPLLPCPCSVCWSSAPSMSCGSRWWKVGQV